MFEEHGVCPMLTLTLFKIFPFEYIWVNDLDLPGSRDITGHVTI